MIRIGMRLTRNTRKVGRRRVGNGMRMILSIGHSRSNVAGNLHKIIRSIRKRERRICGNIANGRRRRRRGNSWKFGSLEVWKLEVRIADCLGFHGCCGFGERAMNRTTTNNSSIRCRDREIAPTKNGQQSAVSGQRSERVAIGRSLLQRGVILLSEFGEVGSAADPNVT